MIGNAAFWLECNGCRKMSCANLYPSTARVSVWTSNKPIGCGATWPMTFANNFLSAHQTKPTRQVCADWPGNCAHARLSFAYFCNTPCMQSFTWCIARIPKTR